MKIIERNLTKICERLNIHLPVKSQEDIDALNDIIYNAGQEIPEFRIFWYRDIYINCGFDDEKMRKLVTDGAPVHFEVSDDLEEHVGVIVKYN